MFFDQAQGAEHMAQGHTVSPAFLPESRVIVTDVRILMEATQPVSSKYMYILSRQDGSLPLCR
jgi:hypothetical protein